MSLKTNIDTNQKPLPLSYDIKKPETYPLDNPAFIQDLQSDPAKLIKAFRRMDKLSSDHQTQKNRFNLLFLPTLKAKYNTLPDFLWLKATLVFSDKLEVPPEHFETKLNKLLYNSCVNPNTNTKKELLQLHKYLQKLYDQTNNPKILPYIKQTLETEDNKKSSVAPLLWLAHCPQPFLFLTFFGSTQKKVSFSEKALIFLNNLFENKPNGPYNYHDLFALYEEVGHLECQDFETLIRTEIKAAPIEATIIDFALSNGFHSLLEDCLAEIKQKYNIWITVNKQNKDTLELRLDKDISQHYDILKIFSDYISIFTVYSESSFQKLCPQLTNLNNVTELHFCGHEELDKHSINSLPQLFPNATSITMHRNSKVHLELLELQWLSVTCAENTFFHMDTLRRVFPNLRFVGFDDSFNREFKFITANEEFAIVKKDSLYLIASYKRPLVIALTEKQRMFMDKFFRKKPTAPMNYQELFDLYKKIKPLEYNDLNQHIINLIEIELKNLPFINAAIIDFALSNELPSILKDYLDLLHQKYNIWITVNKQNKDTLELRLDKDISHHYDIINLFSDYINTFTIYSESSFQKLCPQLTTLRNVIELNFCGYEELDKDSINSLPKLFPNASAITMHRNTKVNLELLDSEWPSVARVKNAFHHKDTLRKVFPKLQFVAFHDSFISPEIVKYVGKKG